MTPIRLLFGPALAAGMLLAPLAADAALLVRVDKTTQRLSVIEDGVTRYRWPISTGRAGYDTPNGTYSPTRLHRTYFSKKYYNSPMPYSIFFHGGYAIHGSNEISKLGGPASHGCVRLHPNNAATLFSLVKEHGAGDTKIVVTGRKPAARPPAVARDEDDDDAEPVYAARPGSPYRAYGQSTYGYRPYVQYRYQPQYRSAPQPYYAPYQPQPYRQAPWW